MGLVVRKPSIACEIDLKKNKRDDGDDGDHALRFSPLGDGLGQTYRWHIDCRD